MLLPPLQYFFALLLRTISAKPHAAIGMSGLGLLVRQHLTSRYRVVPRELLREEAARVFQTQAHVEGERCVSVYLLCGVPTGVYDPVLSSDASSYTWHKIAPLF